MPPAHPPTYSRYVGKTLLVVTELNPINVRGNVGSVFLGALVVATQIFWQLLVVVKHDVCHTIPAYHCVRPELLHEKDLVGKIRSRTWGREGRKESS